MEKWEYLFVKCGDVFVEDWRPKIVNGKELDNWQEGPTIMEYCRQAGIRGWEIISYSLEKTGLSVVFKRPHEGKPGTGTLFQET